jgi:murein DD-endopeptidase MepM/ murein hydrolase activator NlpD
MQAPDTVTEALAFLAGEGYTDELRLHENGLEFDAVEGNHPVRAAIVDYTFRFEGPSDPADEAIVLGVRWSDQGQKGVIVSAFGHDADPESAALLTALVQPSGTSSPRR